MAVEKLIVDHIDTWTTALQPRSSAGRGSSGKIDLYGIKKLRELILELAVRGKLVPQDPNDEPASELLKRIAAEKTELVKQGKIKKQKPLPEISEEEKPFELPVGWEWVTFSHLGHFFGGKTPSKMKDEYWGGTIPWVTPKDMKTNLIVDSEDKVTPLAIEDGLTKVSPGSILFVARSGILRRIFPVAITSIECTVNQDLKVLSPFLSEISYYIRLMMNGFERYIVENLTKTGTTVESLLFDDFISHPFMIPPFAEQNRILSTVKKLMSLCDQLEQHSLTSLDAHQQLVETLLTTLTDSQNADALAENWARISEHFDTLFTTEASIDALKQTILQLAVMGKLVPQDPNDEPASELLKRIAQEKAQLVKDGKIKKQKPLPPISDKEKPFEVPEGWEWCKFGLISEFINGDRGSNYPNKNEYVVHGIPWINTGHIEKNGTLSITDMNFITEKKFNELRSGKIQSGDLVYCLRGATFGKTAFVKPYESGAIASSLMIIRPFIREMGEYIYNYLISPFGRSQIFRFDNGSAQPNLSANSVMLYAFACPPLQEQFRIHKKITELFHICDNLKLQTQSAQQTQLHLADALTDAAIN
ncbi:TPA_asm: restriction endonuclease subunit S [Salmonella enterica subsp. enterica serovar Montevideo]|uniref:Restriction endonuclease subunit S n=17 Tax=Salmonella enterica TaxID=28901 RepID=A0A5Y4M2R6_SALER|nr:restriction endonuclease subunit S [Salmonella enterica]EAY2652638.1 restriction endonuclease subunit S [Salmonella enterica subsp. enterica serovar Dublin]EBG9935390.1 restriction endonuclease subunit S [Salmonella enterica subsp. enterica serovar Cerro]ECN6464082.1 restriction endonuclease subunit S [Salmonella enterica subsp. enterica serovar Typhimurium]ECS7735978.1 restriction endonuclease subunit S [Salmonella enterica subsp. enterica serovar Montevideo str. FSL_R8-4673]ECZ9710368.1 r